MSDTVRAHLLALARVAVIFLRSAVGGAGQAAAQQTLVVYFGVDEKWCRSMANAYQAETGVKVDMTRVNAGQVFARIRADKDSPHGDISWGAPATRICKPPTRA